MITAPGNWSADIGPQLTKSLAFALTVLSMLFKERGFLVDPLQDNDPDDEK
jgi:hypothetical protein